MSTPESPSTDTRAPESGPSVPSVLVWCTWIAVALVTVQLVLGLFMLFGSAPLGLIHEWIGYVATASAVVAAVSAIVWKARGGKTGIMAHAVSMPVLMIVEIILGLSSVNEWVHAVLGLLILIGLIGLPMSLRGADKQSR